jgi:hypothetical protein
MIIVELIGGLGNQMFQYALGRKLALSNKTTLKFDIQQLGWNRRLKIKKHIAGFLNIEMVTPRVYGLGVFDIEENFTNKKEIRKLNLSLVSEPGGAFSFYPEILRAKGGCYLRGFWQAEEYFKDIREVLQKDFRLKDQFSIDDLDIAKEIKACEAVSLHIRRGDYVKIDAINKVHGTCSSKYYVKAADYINEKIANAKFFIFSDDIEWAKENLNFENPTTFVSNGKLKEYEELILMSFCKHHIIANSSFSWWGAWLNPNQGKIVIAPKKWLSDSSIDTHDLIPENWIRL